MHPIEPTTSSKELWAFYFYNMALSGVGQFALVVTFPLILEGLARQNGHLQDSSEPCIALNGTPDINEKPPPCFVDLGNLTLSTTSYATFVISLSVLLQAIVYISIASFGDYGSFRKKFLILFGLLGALTTISIPSAFKGELFWLVGIIIIFVNVFHGASYVFLDGYFPILVRNDPQVLSSEISFDERANEVQTLSQNFGFMTGILLQLGAVPILLFVSQSILTLQLLSSFTGFWWLALGSYTFFNLLTRPGPELPLNSGNYLFFSWKIVFKSFAKWREIPNTFLYLAAFFMFSDGMHTLAQVAILFCSTKLGLSNLETVVVVLLFPVTAICGNFMFFWIQKQTQLTTKYVLIICLSFMSFVPIYALLGAFNTQIGLVHKWEAYMISIVGVFFGPVVAFGKVLFAELIPEGSESEFFALAAISDRGSSWIGPLIVGSITQASNDIRYGLSSVSILFVIAIPLLYFIDVDKGRKDAKAYALEKEEEESLLSDDGLEIDVQHTFDAAA